MSLSIILLASAMMGIWSGADAMVAKDDAGQVVIQPRQFDPPSLLVPMENRNFVPVERKAGVLESGDYDLQPGQSVVIASENYPKKCPKRSQASWSFKVDDATSKITIECEKIMIRKSHKCSAAYLRIFFKRSKFDTICGNKRNFEQTSEANFMEIHFWAGNKKPAKGFKCTVTASASQTTTATTYTSTSAASQDTTNNPQTNAPTNASPQNSKCTCGVANRATRIVGGEDTEIHEYPWQAGLIGYGGSRPGCGGSIIADRWILTAAHCFGRGVTTTDVQILIGEHDWTTGGETSSTQKLDIEQLIPHPNYDNVTEDNDIALIKVKSTISFTSDNKIAPICLPTSYNAFDNINAIVSGWGVLQFEGDQPNTLKEVTVPTMTNKKCQKSYGYEAITGNMICAGPDEGGKDSCQGDSGGPLVAAIDGNKYLTQIGVVSFGSVCAAPGIPGVYARVTSYFSWIQDYIGDSKTCSPPS